MSQEQDAPTALPEALEKLADRRLVKTGFDDVRTARRWLGFGELKGVELEPLLGQLEQTGCPDAAVRCLVRLIEAEPRAAARLKDPQQAQTLIRLLGCSEALGGFLESHPQHLDLLDGPLDPEPEEISADELRSSLLRSVGADPEADTPVAQSVGDDGAAALRVEYRRQLIRIALGDLGAADPVDHLPAVGRQLADLAAAAIEAALAVSRGEIHAGSGSTQADPEELERIRLSVIGMGKCGARELNYISDVDVVYVHDIVDPFGGEDGHEPIDDDRAAVLATALASGTARAVMSNGPEAPLWELDANLRPEGKDGPLSRTLDSHVRYYRKWAKSWEFQALLKARPMAGDQELGRRYSEAISPMVWESSQREGFVSSVQAMRRRVMDNIPSEERDRQVKLGPGGLRDVEFTVQLLQLVHGRGDESVRTRATTDSLAALANAGYIGREDAEEFGAQYRWLRLLEHRIQLFRMRRTHLMPTSTAELAVIAVAMHPPRAGARTGGDDLMERWHKTRRAVRGMHERIFYRPLLAAITNTSFEGVELNQDQVRDRLKALGYRDPKAAHRHLEALTRGVSRRASILRTLLPVLLEWFAEGVDPDAGLLGFRRVSEELGTSPWYLRMLRDSNTGAQRLCHVLSSSRYISDMLETLPEATAWLGTDAELKPRTFATLWAETHAQMGRHPDAESAVRMIRLMRRRESLRVALADTAGLIDVQQVVAALSDIDRAAVLGALYSAERELHREQGVPWAADVLVVAMGRQGGREIGYGSDADVLYVYVPCEDGHEHPDRHEHGLISRPDDAAAPEAADAAEDAEDASTDDTAESDDALSGASDEAAASDDAPDSEAAAQDAPPQQPGAQAARVIERMVQLLKRPCDPPIVAERVLEIDNDLRPEGRSGPMVRSLESYAEYYSRWADTWEFQALTRARPMAGSDLLAERFTELIDPYRYPAELTERQLNEIRRMKARVENERLPRGADPSRHVKLGRGGLSDVEWLVQTLQLQHAHQHPGLRTTSTLDGLEAAVQAELMDSEDAHALAKAWKLCTAIRNGNVLRTGRASDVLPSAGQDMEAVARWCGYPPGSSELLEDDYLRTTRQARAVFERLFYGL